MNTADQGCFQNTLHLFIDFSEKVILPHFFRKPGQLHFVTVLKFDLLGIMISNLSTADIHCLPEGHWHGQRSANKVASIVHYSIGMKKTEPGVPVLKPVLHADNCGGKNKNR